MSYAMVAITVLWTFLFGYLLVASIDFGAGFFSYYSVLTGHENKIHNIIQRYLSPVWEVTNVFLIFCGRTCRILSGSRIIMAPPCLCRAAWPLSLAIRGAYYAYHTYGDQTGNNIVYMGLYGATGLLIPAALSTILAISEGGIIYMDNGKVELHWYTFFTNPYTWSVILLALVSVLYISAMFLSYYARVRG